MVFGFTRSTGCGTGDISAGDRRIDVRRHPSLGPLIERVFGEDPEFQRFGQRGIDAPAGHPVDMLFIDGRESLAPREVFDRLRWGGVAVVACECGKKLDQVARTFTPRMGFAIDRPPQSLSVPRWILPAALLGRRIHFFAARKVSLIHPGDPTDRFTYSVELARKQPPAGITAGYVVLKQLPDADWVAKRLSAKFPDADASVIQKRTAKLIEKVFPVFLTREAAFLSILRRELPDGYRQRVPHVIEVEKDERGFVRRLYLNWLRNRVEPISQFEFAEQGMDLLRVLHDQAKVIHLDLRLDNLVITENGVGFVDFGSAVRVGENLGESQLLSTLFDEMMWTSSIQQTLGKLMAKGKVTSKVINESHHKVDKALDFFFLSLQMNQPHHNPDFVDLVTYDPKSDDARALKALTRRILRPTDPDHPEFSSATEVLRGIHAIHSGAQGSGSGVVGMGDSSTTNAIIAPVTS